MSVASSSGSGSSSSSSSVVVAKKSHSELKWLFGVISGLVGWLGFDARNQGACTHIYMLLKLRQDDDGCNDER